jgi:hypothetical protein
MSETGDDDARIKARNRRNLVIAAALVAFVAIVFAVSVLKMKAGMAP